MYCKISTKAKGLSKVYNRDDIMITRSMYCKICTKAKGLSKGLQGINITILHSL